MKKIFLLLLLAITYRTLAQTDHTISFSGIGAIKTGMSQGELEKLLGKKLPLTNLTDSISGSWQDSATINYKNMQLRLDFQRNFTAENVVYLMLTAIKTSSPLCKTKNGIGIDADKARIIAAYEEYAISIIPDTEETAPAKRKAIIVVKDTIDQKKITFYLINKKVVMIETGIFFSDQE